jgi:hypothetical protein
MLPAFGMACADFLSFFYTANLLLYGNFTRPCVRYPPLARSLQLGTKDSLSELPSILHSIPYLAEFSMDLILLLFTLVFFAATVLLVYACQQLRKSS